jgi:hypothetical protein
MGNCPTTPSESSAKSLDPLCHGERMWTTFLFSSLFTLFGGWFIILIYDFIKALAIKQRRLKLLSIIKRVSHANEVIIHEIIFLFEISNFYSFLQNERVYHGQSLIERVMNQMKIILVGYKRLKNGKII